MTKTDERAKNKTILHSGLCTKEVYRIEICFEYQPLLLSLFLQNKAIQNTTNNTVTNVMQLNTGKWTVKYSKLWLFWSKNKQVAGLQLTTAMNDIMDVSIEHHLVFCPQSNVLQQGCQTHFRSCNKLGIQPNLKWAGPVKPLHNNL